MNATPQTEIIGRHIASPAVFPCRPVSKAPYESGGFHGAITDPDKIREWFARYRDALVGYATGGGIAVIDIDIKKGKNGFETITDLQKQYGQLPATFTVKTMSGGEHRYYKYNAITHTLKCSTDKLATGIDVRASGGYVIVPPSAGYTVHDDLPVADLPQAWLELMREKPKQEAAVSTAHRTTESDIDVAIDCLDYISADCDYNQWLSIAMALKSAGVPFYEFDSWSRTAGAKYGGEDYTARFWNNLKPERIGIGTLVFLAKQNGYRRRHSQQQQQQPRQPEPKRDDPATTEPQPIVTDHAHKDDFSAYYDVTRKEILVRTSEGNWNPYNESQFKRILASKGYAKKADNGQFVSEIDEIIIQTQDKRSLTYAGGLAGWPAGVHEPDCGRILVTKGADLITPAKGEWSRLRLFLETLFADDPMQIYVFYGWMKVAAESLYTRSFRPGQCFVVAGKKGCGKSLLQLLVTEMLGGRFARPYQYMSGKTEFNADMFCAEHLAIEDDVPSTNIGDRRSFGARIKEITANQGQRLHAKGRDAIILPVFWRMTVTVNDEPENLMILPPIDESLTDKIILTKASIATVPCDTQTNEGRLRCWDLLTADIPGFLYWLQSWQIPDELKSPRYGVADYHHPEIMDALTELSPEAKLEQIIDACLFSEAIKMPWAGTASELEQKITSHMAMGYEAKKLMSFNSACGVYLARLANKYPRRYEKKHTSDRNIWTISPPQAGEMKGVKGISNLKTKINHTIKGGDGRRPSKTLTPLHPVQDEDLTALQN